MCTFCHNHSETIFHLFIECQYVENLWKRLEQWIYEKCNILFDFSHIEILFGKPQIYCFEPDYIIIQTIYTKNA